MRENKKYLCKKCSRKIKKYVFDSNDGQCFQCDNSGFSSFFIELLNLTILCPAGLGALGGWLYWGGLWGAVIGGFIGIIIVVFIEGLFL